MAPRKAPPTEVGGAQGRTTCLTVSSAAAPALGPGTVTRGETGRSLAGSACIEPRAGPGDWPGAPAHRGSDGRHETRTGAGRRGSLTFGPGRVRLAGALESGSSADL